MTTDTPDWIRLQKALAIEAEQGFTDLLGKQYRFSEFLTLTFGKFPTGLPSIERRRWQELAAEFANYPNLAVEDRQHLVAESRRYLYQLQQAIEGEAEGDEGDKRDKADKGDNFFIPIIPPFLIPRKCARIRPGSPRQNHVMARG